MAEHLEPCYFQIILVIKIIYLWARPIKSQIHLLEKARKSFFRYKKKLMHRDALCLRLSSYTFNVDQKQEYVRQLSGGEVEDRVEDSIEDRVEDNIEDKMEEARELLDTGSPQVRLDVKKRLDGNMDGKRRA